MPQTPGSSLGPYEIVSMLGAGSMGEVYRAFDPRLRRDVALKVLNGKPSPDLHSEDRFAEEARAAGALNHPNIVSIFDIGHDSGITYIVSELVQGESLRAVLDRGPIPAAQVCEIGVQIASGLAAAHARGIVHRDLKPSNIMLTREGWVKIIDFGLAKQTSPATGEEATLASMTTTGAIVGTLAYMSPEQVRAQSIDARSDVFSLGVVLYEMTSGRRPFDGDDAFEIMQDIVLQEPPLLQAPPALVSIVDRCLYKDPAKRFPNAAELSAALRNVPREESRPAAIAAATPDRRPASWLGFVAVALALAVIIGLGVGTRFWKAKTDGPDGNGNVHTDGSVVSGQPSGVPALEIKDADAAASRKEEIDRKQLADSVSKAVVVAKTDPPARSPVIETFAGRDWSFSGDGLPALQVPIGRSFGVTSDPAGNIYQTDSGNNLLVQIDSAGKLHVLSTGLAAPTGVAVNAAGEIYFAENGRLRKRLTDGSVVVVAGGSQPGSSADGVNAVGAFLGGIQGIALASDGSVIFAEWGNNRVRRVDAQGRLQTVAGDGQARFAGDGGPATQASLLHPSGIALDRQGNLFIADQNNGRVRQVGPDGRIRTVAGLGATLRLGCPTGVAVNRNNELFIADPCLHKVFVLRNGRLSAAGGSGSGHNEPSGDGGPALSASFDQWGLAIDEKENVLVSGPGTGHVYRIGADGMFQVISGNGQWRRPQDGTAARQAVFASLFRIALDPAGNLVISDHDAAALYRVDRKGLVYQVAGQAHKPGYQGENTPARDYAITQPNGVRVQPDGTIVFADVGRVRKVTPEGIMRTVAGNGKAAFSGDGGNALDASLNGPAGVAVDLAGNIYIADAGNNRIRKVTPDGKIQTVAGNGQPGFSGDGGPPELAALQSPRGVEVGPDGAIYICDSENHRVRRVLGGIITTIAGNGTPGFSGDGGPGVTASLQLPVELAVGPAKTLYILDGFAGRIRRLDLTSGKIDIVAGTGQPASGDGGSPVQAGLGVPRGLAVDSTGTIYVADSVSNMIRVIRSPAAQHQ